MLGELLKGIQGEAAGQLSNVEGFDTNQTSGVFDVVGDVLKKEIGGQMLGGNASTLMNLFSGQENNSASNSLQSTISKGIASGLMSKLGMKNNVATPIVNIVLPMIMNKITKVNSGTDDNDLSPIENLLGGSGGIGGTIGGAVGKLF